MPIPEEIRSISRPKNTVVVAYGKNKDKYAVRSRIGCRNENGKRIPIEGPIIGHLENGVYVPIDQRQEVSESSVDLKDWANIELAVYNSRSILDQLCEVHNRNDAIRIFCIAILRVCYHGITDSELKDAYDNSFLSEMFPGVALSHNSVCEFHKNVGRACSLITKFMQNRVSELQENHHLVIDGILKSDESKVNTLSDYSRKH